MGVLLHVVDIALSCLVPALVSAFLFWCGFRLYLVVFLPPAFMLFFFLFFPHPASQHLPPLSPPSFFEPVFGIFGALFSLILLAMIIGFLYAARHRFSELYDDLKRCLPR